MGRNKKPSGRLSSGPFGTEDMVRACLALGAEQVSGGNHSKVYKHPTAGWKFPISTAWTSVRKGDPIFRNLCNAAGVSSKELLRILNDRDA